MRPIRYRAAVLLLTGALWPCLSSCGNSPAPAGGFQLGVETYPREVVLVKADDKKEDAPAKDEKKADDEGFRFPDDKGGQMLAKVLPPADKIPLTDDGGSSKPKRLPGSAALEHPSVPLGPNQGQVPRLPATRKGPPLRPRPLPDDLPLSGMRPEPPQEAQFPAGDRVRLPGPDVNQPAPLPLLAVPAPDRTTDDPTADFSSAAAQSASVPVRTAPAPFVKLSLPDPFENRDVIRLRQTPPEKDEPVSATPKPPMK
jgi:hypothetical protein